MKFIAYHLGLGDALICAGLVNFLSKKGKVVIPCYEKNLISVRSIYENNSNVEVLPVEKADTVGVVSKYHDSITINGNNFPKGFYEQASIDWKERWDSCPVWDICPAKDVFYISDVVFVHDDPERGFNISVDGVRPKNTGSSILSYTTTLIGAREIHCIDSSFLHLVECIPADKFKNNPKFFYHKSARQHSTDYTGCLLHNWNIL